MLYGIDTHRRFFPVQYPNGLVSTFPDDLFTTKEALKDFNELAIDSDEFLTSLGRTTGRMMKILYNCDPSTKKTYISFVPDEINKADDAMAWKFHITRDEFERLLVEA